MEQLPPHVVSAQWRTMACTARIHVAAPPERMAAAAAAIASARQWIDAVALTLTRFDPASELNHLNQAAGRWFHASPELFAAVAAALDAAAASDGLFDPTILPALESAGYDRDFDELPRAPVTGIAATAVPAAQVGAWRAVALRASDMAIRLPKGTRLDLGGIAKGWAADLALQRYLADFTGAIVSLGGDLRVQGTQITGEPWVVGIEDPRNLTEPRHVAIIALNHGGLATSGSTKRWWYQGASPRHHLIDPRTGQPADLWTPTLEIDPPRLALASVLAPTAARAEAATKAALLASPDDLTWPGSNPQWADIAVLRILSDGSHQISTNLDAWLQAAGGQLWWV